MSEVDKNRITLQADHLRKVWTVDVCREVLHSL